MGLLRRQPNSADIEHRIKDAIASMRPLLRMETVQVELLRYEAGEGIAIVRLEGDCPDCDLNAEVLLTGIEAHLRQRVPEIQGVRNASASKATRDG